MSPYERYRRQKHLLKSPSMRMLRRLTAMYASYLHLQLIDSPREWLSDLQTCRVTLKNVCATHRNPFHLQGACKQSAQTKICPPSRLSISFVHYFHRQYALHWFIWNILEFVYKRHFFEQHTPPLSADQIHQQRGKKCTPHLLSLHRGIRVFFDLCPPRSPPHRRTRLFLGSRGVLERSGSS